MFTPIFQWSILVVPWLTLPLMGGRTVRRYLPSVLFITVVNLVVNILAYHYQWWTLHKPLFAWSYMVNVPEVFGIFPVLTLWILRWTYEHFWIYLLVNLANELTFVYGVSYLLDNAGISSTQMARWLILLLMFGSALIMYVFQKWYEGDELEIHIGDGKRKARV